MQPSQAHSRLQTRLSEIFGLIIIIVLGLSLLIGVNLIYGAAQIQNDWEFAFRPAAQGLWAGQNPYDVSPHVGLPWSVFVLAPLAWLPPGPAMLLPLLTLLILSYRLGKPRLIAIVGLSAPFFTTTIWANLDWIIMLGATIGGPIGVILDTVKPQAGIGLIATEMGKCTSWRAWPRLLAPLLILALVTVPWIPGMLDNMTRINADGSVNLIWPATVPIGLYALYRAWRYKSAMWGCLTSVCISPYVQMHSLLPLIFLVADRDWRWGLILNLATWLLVAAVIAGIVPIRL